MVINVDPLKNSPGDGTKRVEIKTDEYKQVVYFITSQDANIECVINLLLSKT